MLVSRGLQKLWWEKFEGSSNFDCKISFLVARGGSCAALFLEQPHVGGGTCGLVAPANFQEPA